MAYTINLTNGSIFATIPDGTINTQSSQTLIGKNYAGYGQFLDDNFIHLLECGANSTPPGAPLTGQLWWDTSTGLLKVYNGTTFKTISAASSSSSAPTSNVTGDLWYDTTNQQLKVYTGTTWLVVGPAYTSGTGVTGAIATTIVDNTSTSHVVIELFVNDSIVGIISKDATFTPQVALTGFTTVRPGITLSTLVGSQVPLFQGTAVLAQGLVGGQPYMLNNANTSTTGTVSVLNNSGLFVGTNSDLNMYVSGTSTFIANQTANGNMYFRVNVGGTPTNALTINGSTGVVSGNQVNANYADVAERFHADTVYEAGTVVELGGDAEITKVGTDLSDKVFGVISTKAAYLMNSAAGSDETHPPVAMTGRVPVKVIGQIAKGDRLVSAGNGFARAAQSGEATAFNVIGRALTGKADTGEGTVEAIVTIK